MGREDLSKIAVPPRGLVLVVCGLSESSDLAVLVRGGGKNLQVDEGDLGGFGGATGTAALTETGIALLPAKALNLLWTLMGASTPIE
ncbi:hypothetical protein TNCV_2663701 [Trichonephila clavipes]|nr:hypothetical protein TNCV_2663701 [Trichonephila clavipes]